MVRIIVGTLIDVGLNKITPESIKEILLLKDRTKAGKTAEAKGLFYVGPEYEEGFNLKKPRYRRKLVLTD